MPMPPTYAPQVPGVSDGNGFPAGQGGVPPMSAVAMMMGDRPTPPDSTTEKMSQIVQLLREVSKEDPRLAMLASDALKLLIEGPSAGPPGGMQGPGGPGGAPMPGGGLSAAGPGGMIG